MEKSNPFLAAQQPSLGALRTPSFTPYPALREDAVFWECFKLKASIFEPSGIPDVQLLADPASITYSL
jgi:hypothetical protein